MVLIHLIGKWSFLLGKFSLIKKFYLTIWVDQLKKEGNWTVSMSYLV